MNFNQASSSSSKTPGLKAKYAKFGGHAPREDLDDDEGAELARIIRAEMAREVVRVRNEQGVDLDLDSVTANDNSKNSVESEKTVGEKL